MMPTSFWSGMFLVMLLTSAIPCQAQGFVETFNGTGPYSSSGDELDTVLEGFDNPGWSYLGDGMFRDGGLWIENRPPPSEETDYLQRTVFGLGDFAHVIEVRDHSLISNPTGEGASSIILSHVFREPTSFINMRVEAIKGDPERYRMHVAALPNASGVHIVEKGPHIRMEISFDQDLSQVSFAYDNNLDDGVPPLDIATLDFQGIPKQEAEATLRIGLFEADAADALIDNWTFTSSKPPIFSGDFNANGTFDAGDIDLLNAEIRRGTNDPAFDLVEDGIVDQFDRNFWVHSLNNTYFGDANLDGEFNSRDLVAVFQSGHYEDGIDLNSGWAEGDWNGNGDFESGDLIVAFQDGGYEAGRRAQVAEIPEPAGITLAMLAALLTAPRTRQKRF